MNYNISKTSEILCELEDSIIEKLPFSLIRFGDGGLKLMYSMARKNRKNVSIIGEKEGIPKKDMQNVLDLWSKYANEADYIDTPSVYDGVSFWSRYKKDFKPINSRTQLLLNDWVRIYNNIGIETNNRKYCNPEFNWLSILNHSPNLLQIMTDRKICFISVYDRLPILSRYNITYKKIVGQYENQFKNSFLDVIDYIESHVDDFDLWLNSSGELGRIYSGRIKELGGRVIDMGFVAQYWQDYRNRPERFNKFMQPNLNNLSMIRLTQQGSNFIKGI